MANPQILGVAEIALKELIEQIVSDTVQNVTGSAFNNAVEILVSKEQLMNIMCVAGAACYKAGHSGVYETSNPSVPERFLN